MKNSDLLYKYTKDKKFKKSNGNIKYIDIHDDEITSKTLNYIAMRFKDFTRYRLMPYTIVLRMVSLIFADKICYLMLDELIYSLFKKTNFELHIMLTKDCEIGPSEYWKSLGIQNTAFIKTRQRTHSTHIDRKIFFEEYGNKVINTNTYKVLISSEEIKEDSYIESKIFSNVHDTMSFPNNTQNHNLDDFISTISESVAELVCNVGCHTDADCLIDINFGIEKNEDVKFFWTSIAIINFSENRLFDKIRYNIDNKIYSPENTVYSNIYKAFENHKKSFDEKYKPEHFFMITAFQNHVSTRDTSCSTSGGTGLTTLIKNIIGRAEQDYSYVLSGNQLILFENSFLDIEDNNFIGFNKEKNFIDYPPEKGILSESLLYVPGTVYNLFLIKEIDENV